jgi:predicted RNase H-like HicB family nuclease
MKTYNFKVVLEPDEDADGNPAWYACCLALLQSGAATSGRTKNEALKNISEVVRMIIEEMIAEGRPLPEAPADQVVVADVSNNRTLFAITVSKAERALGLV